MELRGRLKLIASKTPRCNTVCDIGTDHAYIPIYLIINGICKKAIASDVKKGPVLAASTNISQHNLVDRIETRMGNGLDTIGLDEADTIIIAGMGGLLIKEILSSSFEKASKASALILQPMNAIEVLRKWLYDNGFEIYDEELAAEGEKIYNVIAARWTGLIEKTEDIYFYLGRKLIDKKDALLPRYIKKSIYTLNKAIKEMERAESIEAIELRERYNMLAQGMLDILGSLK